MARYFQPRSWTWRIAMVAILLGVVQLLFSGAMSPETLQGLGYASDIVAQLIGAKDSSPITLIVLGLGFIGVRRKLEQQTLDSERKLLAHI